MPLPEAEICAGADELVPPIPEWWLSASGRGAWHARRALSFHSRVVHHRQNFLRLLPAITQQIEMH